MSAALQINYSGFDTPFFKLPPQVRSPLEAKIDDMGLRLKTFPHRRLKGHDRYRLRVALIESSTPSKRSGTSSTCWPWAIGGKSTGTIEHRTHPRHKAEHRAWGKSK